MLPMMRNYMDQNWFPQVFGDLFENATAGRTTLTNPAMNILQSETGYKVEIAAPGMTKEDLRIHLDQDENLVITFEKTDNNQEVKENDVKYLRQEFSYSKFTKTLILPEDIKKEEIKAQMKDGILTVELPRLKEEDKIQKVRQILIN